MQVEKMLEELRTKYHLVCTACGKHENVVVSVMEDEDYGDETGIQPGYVTVGCNDCKKNDFYF